MQITLANLKEATAKQVFEHVKAHLLTQNQQSLNEKGSCVYRNANGLMCAAGCLISDSEYSGINVHGYGLDEGSVKNWKFLTDNEFTPKDHGNLISELQTIHDHVSVSAWPQKLEQMAITYGFAD